MIRQPSDSTATNPNVQRTRTKRGKRSKLNNINAADMPSSQTAENPVASLEPVAPLVVSATRWTRGPPASEEENVKRKVRALLNKLTMTKFDSISDQIIEWANESETPKDCRTLVQVTRLVFESVIKAGWPEVHALLCRKAMENISPNVQDDGILGTDGKPVTGGQLFRKHILRRCQEELERGWAAADAAATEVSEDPAIKKTAETPEEVKFYSDQFYATQKAKRQDLNLVQFFGELYKMQMLTERIMHECIKKPFARVGCPRVEEIERLCWLLTTVGKLLDSSKAHAHMDIYFVRIKELRENSDLTLRMQFMLQVSPTVWIRRRLPYGFFS